MKEKLTSFAVVTLLIIQSIECRTTAKKVNHFDKEFSTTKTTKTDGFEKLTTPKDGDFLKSFTTPKDGHHFKEFTTPKDGDFLKSFTTPKDGHGFMKFTTPKDGDFFKSFTTPKDGHGFKEFTTPEDGHSFTTPKDGDSHSQKLPATTESSFSMKPRLVKLKIIYSGYEILYAIKQEVERKEGKQLSPLNLELLNPEVLTKDNLLCEGQDDVKLNKLRCKLRFDSKPNVCQVVEDIMLKLKGTLLSKTPINNENIEIEIKFVWLKKYLPRPTKSEEFSYSVSMNLGLQGGRNIAGNKKVISLVKDLNLKLKPDSIPSCVSRDPEIQEMINKIEGSCQVGLAVCAKRMPGLVILGKNQFMTYEMAKLDKMCWLVDEQTKVIYQPGIGSVASGHVTIHHGCKPMMMTMMMMMTKTMPIPDTSLMKLVDRFIGITPTKINFNVLKQNIRPVVAVGQIIPFYVPKNLADNKCVSIGKILDQDRSEFKIGKSPAVSTKSAAKAFKTTPIFTDPDEEKSIREKAGIAISSLKGEGFKFSCEANVAAKPLTFGKGKVFLLNRACCIMFEPKKDNVWDNEEVSFKAFGWDGSNDKAAGSVLALDEVESSDAFSVDQMKGSIPRENCDGILGRPCQRKQCPTGSEEQCGECIKGSTGKKESENFICGKCNKKDLLSSYGSIEKFPQSLKKDCNNDCGGNAVEICGTCAGGNTKIDPKSLKDACGQCISDKAKCDTSALNVKDVFPREMDGGFSYRVNICLDKADTAVKKCRLVQVDKPDTVCMMNEKKPQSVPDFDRELITGCKKIDLPRFKVDLKQCFALYTGDKCAAGSYKLNCTSGDKKVMSNHHVTIKDFKAVVLKKIINKGFSKGPNMIDIEAEGFEVGKMYKACYRPCEGRDCCTSPLSAKAIGKARFFFKNVQVPQEPNKEIKIFIRDCLNRESNEIPLGLDSQNACGAIPKYLKHIVDEDNGKRSCLVVFDKPLSPSDKCDKTLYSVLKLGKKFSKVLVINNFKLVDNAIVIPKKCLSCSASLDGDLSIPIENKCPESVTKIKMSPCRKINIRLPRKTFRNVRGVWSVVQETAGLEKLKRSLQSMSRDLSHVDVPSIIKDGDVLDFKFCFKDPEGRECCKMFKVIFDGNSNLAAKIREKGIGKNRVFQAYATRCNQMIKRDSYSAVFTYRPIIKNSTLPQIAQKLSGYRVLFEELKNKKPRLLDIMLTVTDDEGRNSSTSVQKFFKGDNKQLRIGREGQKEICVPCSEKQRVLAVGLFDGRQHIKNIVKSNIAWHLGNTKVDGDSKVLLDLSEQICDTTIKVTAAYEEYYASINLQYFSSCSEEEISRCEVPKQSSDNNIAEIGCIVKKADLTTDDLTVEFDPLDEEEILKENQENPNVEHAVTFNTTEGVKMHLKKLKNNVFKVALKVNKSLLDGDKKYRMKVILKGKNDELKERRISIRKKGKPADCKVIANPPNGVSMNTSFVLNIYGCSKDVESKIELMKGKVGRSLAGSSDSMDIDIGKLSDFDTENGVAKLKLRLKPKMTDDESVDESDIRGDDDQEVELQVEIPIEKDPNINEQEFTFQRQEEAKKFIKNGEPQKAISQDLGLIDSINRTSALCSPVAMEGTKRLQQIGDEAAGKMKHELARKAFGKRCGDDESQGQSDEIKQKIAELYPKPIPQESEQTRRRRRSIDESDTVEDVLYSVEEVDSIVDSYESGLFPVLYTNASNELRSNFKSILPKLVRSIAKNMEAKTMVSLEGKNGNLKFYAHRIETIMTNVDISFINGSKLSFEESTKNKYDLWQCSDVSDECAGFYYVTSWSNGDIMSDSILEDKTLITPLVSVSLINPLSSGDFNAIEDNSVVVPIVFPIEARGENDSSIYCHRWSGSDWSTIGCTTTAQGEEVTCRCESALGTQIAVFEVSEIAEVEILVQESLQTTPVPTTTTITTSSEASNQGQDSTPMNGGSSPTESPGLTSPSGSTASNSENNRPVETKIKLSYEGDYQMVVGKFNDEESARVSICDQVRSNLKLSQSEFTKCTIRSGSVIVEFVLVQDTTTGNKTVNDLKIQVSSNTIKITFNDGDELSTNSNSLTVADVQYVPPSPPKEEDDDDDATIIIAVVVVIVILAIFVAMILFFYVKQKQNNQNKVEPDYKKMSKNNSPTGSNVEVRSQAGIANPVYDSKE